MAKLKNPIILLDIDGVLADFVGSAFKAHGKTADEYHTTLRNWPHGVTWMNEIWKMELQDFWDKINALEEEFWASMPEYMYAHSLYDSLVERADTYLCSSPSLHPACVAGKVKWIQRHFGVKFRKYILTSQKHVAAKPTTILIDDFDINCDKFHKYGGHRILFPQPWNSAWPSVNRRVEHTIHILDHILDGGNDA